MTDCGPWARWECCLLLPQCIIILFLCFVFFFFHFHATFPISHPLSYPFLSCAHLSTHLFSSGCGYLKSSTLSIIQLLSGHQPPPAPPPNPPTQHLPFRHSANLSPWNLPNSPCTHSAVPLISCSLHPPLLLFLALSALAAWQLLEPSQLSSYHQLTEVCESTWMCKCMFGNNGTSVYMWACMCHPNLGFSLRCSAPVFSKTLQTMSETVFYYTQALSGSSTLLYLFSVQELGLKWY